MPVLHRLRQRLSSLHARKTKANGQKPEHDERGQPQDARRDEDELATPALTTSSTLDDSPATPSPALQLPPQLRVTTTAAASISSPPTPVTPSPSKRELTWRERRLTAKPVPASIVHAYTPPPPRPKPKLTTLPPELLHAIFLYLQGDPTRPDNVAYRASDAGQDDAARWYSHSWSLMQVSRTCAYLRAVAAPLLYSGAALLVKDDFERLRRAAERVRTRIRHLTVSISALEHLHVYLSILHLAHVESSSPTPGFPGVYLQPRADGKKPIVRGSPFAPSLAPTQITRLTLFRPRGESNRSGDAVLRGFSAFFADALAYWTQLELLEVRDPRGEWHLPLDDANDERWSAPLQTAKLRRLKWDVELPLPCLKHAESLRALYLGARVPDLSSSSPPASSNHLSLPTGLQTLHIPVPGPCTPPALLQRLPTLANLRDLRIPLASVTASPLDALHLPPSLEILHLGVPTLPDIPALARAVSHLRSLRILLLSLPNNPAAIAPGLRAAAGATKSTGAWKSRAATKSPAASKSPTAPKSPGSPKSPERKSPQRAACESLPTHIAHRELARRVMGAARGVGEVRVGACVWGRAGSAHGEDVEVNGDGEFEEVEVEVVWVEEQCRMGLPAVWD